MDRRNPGLPHLRQRRGRHGLRLGPGAYIALGGTALLTQFLATFEEFPPRQRAASFTIDQAVEKLESSLASGR